MRIDYLLVKPKDDFCRSADQFINLLRSNVRLSIDDEHIFLSEYQYDYKVTLSDVTWNKNKETVFELTVSSTGETDIQGLEEFDRLLRRINESYGERFVINTIWDEVSMYFTKLLYPKMVETENLLRKLIYIFMIKG